MRGRLKWQWNGYDITCLHLFGSDIEADQPTPKRITQHPHFQAICLQREGLDTAIVGLWSVRNESTNR